MPGCSSSSSASSRSALPAESRPFGRSYRCSCECWPDHPAAGRPADRRGTHDERRQTCPLGTTPSGSWARSDQHLRSTRCSGSVSPRSRRRDALDEVLSGINAAVKAGLDPVKVNVVVVRGWNEDEIVDFAEFGRRTGVQPRFIEFMPLDAGDDLVDGPGRRRRRDRGSHRRRVPPRRGRARPRAGIPLALPRRRRRNWRHPVGHQALLRRLRPSPSHGRRVVHDLPVRSRRLRLPHRRCEPVRSDGELADLAARAVGLKWAGHRIGKVDFVRPRALDEPDRRLTGRGRFAAGLDDPARKAFPVTDFSPV